MSKRAEAAALKAYPPTYTTVKRHAKRIQSELVDTHKPVRAIFQQGYEQAEKDIEALILKYLDSRNDRDYSTVGWIKKHFGEYKKEIMEEEYE